MVRRISEAFINQEDYPSVFGRADNSPCGLHYFDHTGVNVSVFVTGPERMRELIFDDLPFQADLRVSDTHDNGAA